MSGFRIWKVIKESLTLFLQALSSASKTKMYGDATARLPMFRASDRPTFSVKWMGWIRLSSAANQSISSRVPSFDPSFTITISMSLTDCDRQDAMAS
jgi:hypothetical protein